MTFAPDLHRSKQYCNRTSNVLKNLKEKKYRKENRMRNAQIMKAKWLYLFYYFILTSTYL